MAELIFVGPDQQSADWSREPFVIDSSATVAVIDIEDIVVVEECEKCQHHS